MPYIAPESRKLLDVHINQLAQAIVDQAGKDQADPSYAGLLNYACTRLALKVIQLKFDRLRYWIIATTVGVFKNIADEFYRRVGVPYEDLQIQKNGDVDLYLEVASQNREREALLSKWVADLHLSIRSLKCMRRLGIDTLGDLVQRTADDLLESKNFGPTCLREVETKLAQFGLKLRGE